MKNQKIYYYSTPKTRKTIEAALNDRKLCEGKTVSKLIEDILLAALLPTHEEARYWVENLYADADLARAYEAVFAYCAAGLGNEAKETNARPLVEQLLDAAKAQNVTLTGAEQPILHLISQMESIKERLAREPGTEDEVSYANELLRQLGAEQNAPRLVQHCIQFILDNWETLATYGRTYRALVDLAGLIAPESEPRSRCRFVHALKEVSDAWRQ